ncbi:MAG: hypothetical protein WBC51_00690 [Vicinamibacterales bacterium]
MAFILAVFQTEDYDTWKQMFDSDPAGRKQSGKGHRVFRGVDNPNEVFVGVDFASGALDNVTITKEPTVTELADETRY